MMQRAFRPQRAMTRIGARAFSGYDGKMVQSDQLIKQKDDWVIEETNFCLGRMSFPRFRETDDLARRTQMLMDSQISKMHTRLRDGTVIPVMDLYGDGIVDKPVPGHIFVEQPLIKYTWDETYEEAFEKPEDK